MAQTLREPMILDTQKCPVCYWTRLGIKFDFNTFVCIHCLDEAHRWINNLRDKKEIPST